MSRLAHRTITSYNTVPQDGAGAHNDSRCSSDDYLVTLKGAMGEQDQGQRAWLSRTLNALAAFVIAAYALIVHKITASSYFLLGICALATLVAISLDRRSLRQDKSTKARNLAPDQPPQQSEEGQQLAFDFSHALPDGDDDHVVRGRPYVRAINGRDILCRSNTRLSVSPALLPTRWT
jgi:hypothetical protein